MEISPIRIAVCFSGQPRTWKKCAGTWQKLFQSIECKLGGKIDVFAHLWDSNTYPHAMIAAPGPENFLQNTGIKIEKNEIKDLLSTLSVKNYIVDDLELGISKVKETKESTEENRQIYGEPACYWAASQFYSVMKAAHIKKSYEFREKFRYDYCFRMRFDLYFEDRQIEQVLRDLEKPKENTVYPCHTSLDRSQFPDYRMGDIFWYADSTSYDRICDFYRWMPIIGTKSFRPGLVSVEHALYFYTRMIRMDVSPISVDPKIARVDNYLIKKKDIGLADELGGHEII